MKAKTDLKAGTASTPDDCNGGLIPKKRIAGDSGGTLN